MPAPTDLRERRVAWCASTWSPRTGTNSTSPGHLLPPPLRDRADGEVYDGPEEVPLLRDVARGVPRPAQRDCSPSTTPTTRVIVEFDLLGTHEGSCAASRRPAGASAAACCAIFVFAPTATASSASASTSTARRSSASDRSGMVIEDLDARQCRPGKLGRCRPARLDADQERHLKPLPVAVDIVEAGLPQPYELGFDVERAVGRVSFSSGSSIAAKNATCNRWVGEATCSKFANTPPGSSTSKTSS